MTDLSEEYRKELAGYWSWSTQKTKEERELAVKMAAIQFQMVEFARGIIDEEKS